MIKCTEREPKFENSSQSMTYLKTLTQWVKNKLFEMMGHDDNVAFEYICNTIKEEQLPPSTQVKSTLARFLTKEKSDHFVDDLYELIENAKKSKSNIPDVFVSKQIDEIRRKNGQNNGKILEYSDKKFKGYGLPKKFEKNPYLNLGVPSTPTAIDNERWQEQHSSFREKARLLKSDEILFVGDAVIVGLPQFPLLWEEFFANKPIHFFGISCDRVQNVLYRLSDGEIPIHASLIVLNCGEGNVDHDLPDDIVCGIKAIVFEIQKVNPSCSILVIGLQPRGIHWLDRRERIKMINNGLRQAFDHKNVFNVWYLHPGNEWTFSDGKLDPSLYLPDFYHLSENGLRKLAYLICQAIDCIFSEKLSLSYKKLLNKELLQIDEANCSFNSESEFSDLQVKNSDFDSDNSKFSSSRASSPDQFRLLPQNYPKELNDHDPKRNMLSFDNINTGKGRATKKNIASKFEAQQKTIPAIPKQKYNDNNNNKIMEKINNKERPKHSINENYPKSMSNAHGVRKIRIKENAQTKSYERNCKDSKSMKERKNRKVLHAKSPFEMEVLKNQLSELKHKTTGFDSESLKRLLTEFESRRNFENPIPLCSTSQFETTTSTNNYFDHNLLFDREFPYQDSNRNFSGVRQGLNEYNNDKDDYSTQKTFPKKLKLIDTSNFVSNNQPEEGEWNLEMEKSQSFKSLAKIMPVKGDQSIKPLKRDVYYSRKMNSNLSPRLYKAETTPGNINKTPHDASQRTFKKTY